MGCPGRHGETLPYVAPEPLVCPEDARCSASTLGLRSPLKASIFRSISNPWNMSRARRCGQTSNADEADGTFNYVSGCGPGPPPGCGGHAARGDPRPSAA